MNLSPFALVSLGAVSFFIPHSRAFSTSRLISSSAAKKHSSRRRFRQCLNKDYQRGYLDGGNPVLQVATDPTAITSDTNEDDNRSYDFISVEEAEEALEEERARYEGERSELEWLLEAQRQQLQDLEDGRREKETSGVKNKVSRAAKPSRIVILGAQGHVNANVNNNGKRNRKKSNRRGFRNSTNRIDRDSSIGDDDNYLKMEQLENLLQIAIVENEKLTRRLREQHHQYNIERSVYEDELLEERGRLNCVRDELHMERAYFETSRRMLEQLLQEEQQKVRELENQLMMMMSAHGEVLSYEEQSQEEYQEQRRQEEAQNQRMQQQHTHNHRNNEGRHEQQKRRHVGSQPGFTMNINDVQCPLYP